ncbi:MAG: phage major capsid protein [Actinomycetota bacterium]|nr:phage major capsid protein [Actinomycetota bacterium]
MPKLATLERQRNELIAETDELLSKCESEKRDFSRRESAENRERERQLEAIDAELGLLRSLHPRQIIDNTDAAEDRRPGFALGPEDRMADWQAEHGARATNYSAAESRDFSLGRLVRGMVTGEWSDADLERRALSEGTGAAGGFLTPEPLAVSVIDRVRNQARVIEAGARTIAMESDSLSIPRLTGGVTAGWRAENAAVAESDHVFDRVTFTARTLAVLTRLSYELFQDLTPEGAQIIENEMIQSLAIELDRVALRGTGTPPEPKGVKNHTGVTTLTNGANGTAMSYSMLIAASAAVQAANFSPNASILAPRATKSLAGLLDLQNRFMTPPPYLDGHSLLVTSQIPINLTTGTSTDTSEIYTGQWDQLLIGFRPQVSIQIEASGGPGGMIGLKSSQERYVDTMQVGILAFLRADVQVQHGEAFALNTGVRP